MINNKGTASVFLIFIFVILVGAIGILLEGSRYKMFDTCFKELLDVSANSAMTEYYRPLYDDYHLFFLAFAKGEDKEKYIKTRVDRYLSYGLDPVKEQSILEKSMYNKALFIPETYDTQVTEVTTALEKDGKAFEEEAVSYIKYKSVEHLVGSLREAVQLTNNLNSSTKAVAEKIKCEELLNRNSHDIMELMELIDGVSITDKGKVQIRSSFVKCLVPGTITMNSLGVNNKDLWIKLRKKCINVNQLLQQIGQDVDAIESLSSIRAELIEERIENTAKNEETEERLKELSEEIDNKLEHIHKSSTVFSKLVEESKKKTQEAISIIQKISNNEKQVKKQIKKYEYELSQNEEEMEADLRDSLREDVNNLRAITAKGMDTEDLVRILEENEKILASLWTLEGKGMANSWNQNMVEENLKLLQAYNIDSIVFSYGNVSNQDVENPLTKMKQLLGQSILELVIQREVDISEKKLGNVLLQEQQEQTDKKKGLGEVLLGLGEMKNVSQAIDVLGDGKEISIEAVNGLVNKVLLLFYEEEHFRDFLSTESNEKQSLDYEMEYILQGCSSDKENLSRITEQMVLWKTIFNFMGILTDSQKKQLAKETAIAIAGITGIEPLIHVTETIILMVWAFDEALVDVAGLLMGKECLVLKKGKDFVVRFSDLLVVNKKLIQSRASILKEKVRGGITYELVLSIMNLRMSDKVKRFRAMELINQNMIIRYSKDFTFDNCVYSFAINAKAEVRDKFLFLQMGKTKIEKGRLVWMSQAKSKLSY